MGLTLEIFTNDKYNILKLLYENQVKIKSDFYIPLSQQEIADLAHFSKLKTNKIINELIDYELVGTFQGKKGKYILTDRAYKIINLLQNTII